MEHLGATEWTDNDLGVYAPTGKAQPGTFYVTSSALQRLISNPIAVEGLERTSVAKPFFGIGFLGVGAPYSRLVPAVGYLPQPQYLLSAIPSGHIEKVDYHRMLKEIRTLLRITLALETAPSSELK